MLNNDNNLILTYIRFVFRQNIIVHQGKNKMYTENVIKYQM